MSEPVRVPGPDSPGTLEGDGTHVRPADGALDAALLARALDALVHDGVLDRAQADRVSAEVAEQAAAVADAVGPEPSSATGTPGAAAPRPTAAAWRARLLEAAVYLGTAMVLAAIAIVIGQEWARMPAVLRTALVCGLTATGLVAGLAVGWPVRPAPGGPLDPAHAVRRRSAGVLLTATAALAAGSTVALLGESRVTSPLAFGAALAVMVLAQVVAPSVLTELALFAAAAGVTGAFAGTVLAAPAPDASPEAWERQNLVLTWSLLGFGATWAWVLARRLRHPLLAVTLGLALCVETALSWTVPEDATPTVLVLALLAVATLVTYLRDPAWPWVVATVASATSVVVLVTGEAAGPALAFLAAGLVLLGSAGTVAVVRRRRARRAPRAR